MSQQTLKNSNTQQLKAPFRAKSAGVSLFAILSIGLYFAANALSLFGSGESVPEGALNLAMITVVLIIIVEAVLQIVLFIGAGQIEDRSTRDDIIAAKASRNAYFVLTAGVFTGFASMFVGLSPFEMASVVIVFFLLAETIRFASQMLYYGRSA